MVLDKMAIKIRLIDGTECWLIESISFGKFDDWLKRNIEDSISLSSRYFYICELERELQNKNLFQSLIYKDKIRYRFKFQKSLTSIYIPTFKIVSIQHTRLENLTNWSRWEKL